MHKQNINTRMLLLARSTEARIKRLPSLVRREFRVCANRQVNALAKIDRELEILSRELERQRVQLEKTSQPDGEKRDDINSSR